MTHLRRLVRLHRHRLTQAERTLCQMKGQLAERKHLQAQCQEHLNAHRITARERERAIYGTIFGYNVKRAAIDTAKEAVACMRHEEVMLMERCNQAELAVLQATKGVDAARHDYTRQSIRTEKYLELSKTFNHLVTLALQSKQELDAEEFQGARTCQHHQAITHAGSITSENSTLTRPQVDHPDD